MEILNDLVPGESSWRRLLALIIHRGALPVEDVTRAAKAVEHEVLLTDVNGQIINNHVDKYGTTVGQDVRGPAPRGRRSVGRIFGRRI